MWTFMRASDAGEGPVKLSDGDSTPAGWHGLEKKSAISVIVKPGYRLSQEATRLSQTESYGDPQLRPGGPVFIVTSCHHHFELVGSSNAGKSFSVARFHAQ